MEFDVKDSQSTKTTIKLYCSSQFSENDFGNPVDKKTI